LVKGEESRDKISLSHQGRQYNKETINMHKKNLKGRTLSDAIKAKMAINYRGVSIYMYVLDHYLDENFHLILINFILLFS